MKCANCSSPALYVYDPPSISATPYCDAHLPSFLRRAAKDGSLTKAPAFDESKDRALAALAAPAPEPIEEKPEPTKTTRRRRKAEPVEKVAEEAEQA